MMTLERCISLPCRCFRFSASLDGLAVFFRPPYVPHSPSSWLVEFDDKAAKNSRAPGYRNCTIRRTVLLYDTKTSFTAHRTTNKYFQ